PPDNFVKTKLKLTDTDPYTVLLMHMDGSDNGTTFTDECGKTVTAHGDVCTKTAEKKFGTASAYFDGNGDYLSVPASEDFNFGAGDFTIDLWVKRSVISNALECLVTIGGNSPGGGVYGGSVGVFINTDNTL